MTRHFDDCLNMFATLRPHYNALFMLVITSIVSFFALDALHISHQLQQPTGVVSLIKHVSHPATQTQPLPKLANMAIFGHAQRHPSAQPLPAADLDFTLVGVVMDSTASQSQALIRGVNQEEHVYYPNQLLPDGSKLIHIYPDHIVLQAHQGQLTLSLPRSSGSA